MLARQAMLQDFFFVPVSIRFICCIQHVHVAPRLESHYIGTQSASERDLDKEINPWIDLEYSTRLSYVQRNKIRGYNHI